MHYDLVRSLNKSVPWMVMEQSSFRVNWRERNVPKSPGQMRALSYQALARGASGVLFFQWRASRAGAEKFHSALLPHSGQASPVWAEVTQLGRELAQPEPWATAEVVADVALVFSYANWWAVESSTSPAHDLKMQDQLTWMYLPLYRRCVTLDFASPVEPLERYKALLVPSLYLVTEDEAANIRSYVEQGGTAVISFWSGIVDSHDRVYLGAYGGPLRPLFGCDVLDVAPLAPADVVEVSWEDGAKTSATFWVDLVAEPQEQRGKVLARVTSGPWAGTPAVVHSRYGKGSVYYIGTRLDHDGLQRVYDLVPALRPAQSDFSAGLSDDVERVVRHSPDRDYEFVINHTDSDRKVLLAAPGYDVLGERPADGTLSLGRRGVAVVRHG